MVDDASWVRLDQAGFIGHIGPLLQRTDESGIMLGLQTHDHHHNARGYVQGGLIATLLDIAIGRNIRNAYPANSYATIDLQIRYFASISIGAFIIAKGRVDRRTRSLSFASGSLEVEGEVVASGSGVWRNLTH